MVQTIIKKILFNRITAILLSKLMLKLHNLTYKLSAIFSTILNGGVHPKHNIIQYEKWFYENIKKDDVVVDIGCNTGLVVEYLSNKAEYVYGIEINQSLVDQAKLNINKPNVKFFCFDATIYDYSECRDITVVTLSNVLEHIEHRVIFLKKIIKQIPWGSKSNKIILIRVPMIDRDWISVYKKQVGVEYRLDKTHYTEYTYSQLKDELSKSNIIITNSHVRFGELYAICKVI
jgi:2-polyprenyl-3-methyl-5-hydroxy-6-metoxy-1,4-benzoquinol methylase